MKRCLLLVVLIFAACSTIDQAPPISSATPAAASNRAATAVAKPTASAQPTATQPVQMSPGVEKEIVDFAVDFIRNAEIRDLENYIQQSDQPWVPGAPAASIIVYSSVIYDPAHPDWGPGLDDKHPLRVWWYEKGQLTETDQNNEAIARYEEQYMATPVADIFAWGYYDFGIASVSDDGKEAQLYVGASCGPVCGHGLLYTIRRQPSGKWLIIDQKHLWQS